MSDLSSAERARIEQRALWIGAWSGLAMGGLGFLFAVLTGSDAILFDGIFSIVGFVVALATIRVSQLIASPADDRFQFGFATFEPLVTLGKAVIVGLVAVFALVSSINAILHGGREVAAGFAALYATIAAGGCFAVAALLKGAARRTGSVLLDVDVRTWTIDGALSGALAVAFGVIFLIRDTGLGWLVPYVDPGLVAALAIAIAPVPVRIAREGFAELMGGAPEPRMQDEVRALLASDFAELSDLVPRIRMLKAGRLVYVQVYLIVPAHVEIGRVALLDEVRERIHAALSAELPDLALDVIFTGDGRWLGTSVGSPEAGVAGEGPAGTRQEGS